MNGAAIARAWEQAWNAFDADALVALAHEDLEIVTMHRGTLRGHEALRAWVQRQSYGVALHTRVLRVFVRDDVAVAQTRTEWRYVDSGELADTSSGALAFAVRDGRLTRMSIHDGVQAALEAAGLDEADVVDGA